MIAAFPILREDTLLKRAVEEKDREDEVKELEKEKAERAGASGWRIDIARHGIYRMALLDSDSESQAPFAGGVPGGSGWADRIWSIGLEFIRVV